MQTDPCWTAGPADMFGPKQVSDGGAEDCARAAIGAADLGCPSGPFNLGSASPPSTRELLSAVIAHPKSRSLLIPTPAVPLKVLLACLDRLGMTLLYPEQFLIADVDILLEHAALTRMEPRKRRYQYDDCFL
jgi:hypothetical protein